MRSPTYLQHTSTLWNPQTCSAHMHVLCRWWRCPDFNTRTCRHANTHGVSLRKIVWDAPTAILVGCSAVVSHYEWQRCYPNPTIEATVMQASITVTHPRMMRRQSVDDFYAGELMNRMNWSEVRIPSPH